MAYLQPKNMRVGSFLFSSVLVLVHFNFWQRIHYQMTNRHNSKYKAYQEPDTPPTIIEKQQAKGDQWGPNYNFELAN